MAERVDVKLAEFLAESNWIEGIRRGPTGAEYDAALRFLALPSLTVESLAGLQAVIAPSRPIRDRPGMNVTVGGHTPPPGGQGILDLLRVLLLDADTTDPCRVHVEFELLHPFLDGNGRVGRLVWLWQMHTQGRQPYRLPFLHRWYYQSLSASRGESRG